MNLWLWGLGDRPTGTLEFTCKHYYILKKQGTLWLFSGKDFVLSLWGTQGLNPGVGTKISSHKLCDAAKKKKRKQITNKELLYSTRNSAQYC